MSTPLPIVNLQTATFDCSYGRGCDGVCCKNAEPPILEHEQRVLAAHLPRILPHSGPEARDLIEREGHLGELHADGDPMLRQADEWCVFFNRGCVLHQMGAAEGDVTRYKPAACSLFPLQLNADGDWFVRQWGVENEDWDLFCLNPANSARPAAESLTREIALAAVFDDLPTLAFPEDRPKREALDTYGGDFNNDRYSSASPGLCLAPVS